MTNSILTAAKYAGRKKRLQIEGWRGISHSFAMVNQHQILALLRTELLEIYHRDLPFFMPHWNAKSNSAGFQGEDDQLIASLGELQDGVPDYCFQICAPVPAPRIPSAKTLTFMVTEFGMDLSEDGVRVVPHGVDASVFFPISGGERVHLRKNLGIGNDTTVFLNVGAPLWNKGIDILLNAYARTHQTNPDTRLIIKDGSQLYGLSIQSTMGNFAKEHPHLISQSFLDSISIVSTNLTQIQLSQLYAVSDCYVSPYRAEGFNLPALEALSCGKPIIVSSGGATDDFCHGPAVSRIPSSFHRGPIGNHQSACWVEPDIAALIELMKVAVRRGPNDADIENAAVAQAQRYTWHSVAQSILNLYDPAV